MSPDYTVKLYAQNILWSIHQKPFTLFGKIHSIFNKNYKNEQKECIQIN